MSWNPIIEKALEAGLSIVNGLYDLLSPKWQKKIKIRSMDMGCKATSIYLQ